MASSKVVLTCHNPVCGSEFTKALGEFNRSQKLGRLHFCSLKCHAQYRGLGKGDFKRSTSHFKDVIRRDVFSPFRYHLKVMKKSSKRRKHECFVTLADLKHLWEKQNGICPYTGWNLVLLPCTTDYQSSTFSINRASVDRIDSSKGYTIDNIQFVAAIANYAKMAFTEEELISFCYSVDRYRNLSIESSTQDVLPSCAANLFLRNRRDKYSLFRQHLKLARRRVKTHGRECTITLEYLKELWEKQDGRCPYTGWQLDNPETTAHWDTQKLHPKTASLDRIDSSVG